MPDRAEDRADEAPRLRAEAARLTAELELARTAIEDNEQGRSEMLAELNRLRQDLKDRETLRQTAQQTVRLLRRKLDVAHVSVAAAHAGDVRPSTAEEELRVAVEELRVLAEELDNVNAKLRAANAELDRRVAQRTTELAVANSKLVESNRELERRVETEVAARESVQAALYRQRKLEALGQLTGGVAHDFNNLLTVVMSGLHMLSRAETEERRAQLTGRIEQAVQRGSELTRRLLAFGRRQSLRPEPLDLTARMSELRDLLGHSLRADLRIETQVEAGVWPIEVDHGALELALLNLAVNARDAMPHGGVVMLAARNRMVDAGEAATMDVTPGEYVELSVADSGTGMPPEVLARVFEPFFTTKEDGRGSGLGLAQVYGFARQSGGTAWVDSEWGEGCTVSLLLPRSTRDPAQAAPAQTATEATARKATVLVVEDDDEVAALVMDLLGQFGYAATRVSSADAALGALSNDRRLDMVFTDVLLPGGVNGVDLAHEVRRRRPEVAIVLTSGYGSDLIEGMGSIEWPLLRKPFQPETLRDMVEAALAERGEKPTGS